ncbi:Deoxyribonuclease tatd [Mycena indigotica]|uniref:Deoxyribonuclease tatd n=1 Tax=Mycena indigotica TaxID=2126181 RepID=A0A8H6SV61_9AGAR|nr:Deoxyribonuclease tatd [Mycena indigotica]KAF7306770.1 Deoxyribonuclease tatd [Mycena indigotica]
MPVTVVPRPSIEPQLHPSSFQFIDVGVNLSDPVFRGSYRGKQRHEDDMEDMLQRSKAAGVVSQIITGTSLRESQEAAALAKRFGLYFTIGCHPTRVAEFDRHKGGPQAYLDALEKLISANLKGKGRVVAVGECGLDYDRLHFASEEVQRKYFRIQLALARKYNLPLFLHDFVKILREEGFAENDKALGVVHSFTGTPEEAIELMDMGFHLSVNGCSLKTEDNLRAAKTIRPERILLETDAPWCSMTGGHASKEHLASLPQSLRDVYFPPAARPEQFTTGKAVKGRNEPCAIGGVAWVIHKLHGVPFDKVVAKAFKNTCELFGLDDIEPNSPS